MIDVLIIIGCIAMGVLLLLIEFTIIPGITIAGIGAIAIFVYSIFLAYTQFGIWGAIITSLFILIGSPIFIIKLLKGKAGKHMRLDTEIDGTAHADPKDFFAVGDTGVALTRLGPIGKIMVNEKEFEAKSMGPMIDSGQNIIIISIESNQIIVKPIDKSE